MGEEWGHPVTTGCTYVLLVTPSSLTPSVLVIANEAVHKLSQPPVPGGRPGPPTPLATRPSALSPASGHSLTLSLLGVGSSAPRASGGSLQLQGWGGDKGPESRALSFEPCLGVET